MRRAFVQELPREQNATVTLDSRQSRHLRNVLRLVAGDEVELFDAAGATAAARIESTSGEAVVVIVEKLNTAAIPTAVVIVASAIPKGDRADWMVEKLSEIGVTEWIPLECERSVVVPGGVAKFQRWERIATEAARQSRRTGVMRISPMRKIAEIDIAATSIFLSTQHDAPPLHDRLRARPGRDAVLLLIGPEGGWTDREMASFQSCSVEGARLTDTILRTETAAVVAGAIAVSILTVGTT